MCILIGVVFLNHQIKILSWFMQNKSTIWLGTVEIETKLKFKQFEFRFSITNFFLSNIKVPGNSYAANYYWFLFFFKQLFTFHFQSTTAWRWSNQLIHHHLLSFQKQKTCQLYNNNNNKQDKRQRYLTDEFGKRLKK